MLWFIIDKYRYLNGYGKHKWCSLCSTALQHCEYSKYIYVIVELQTKSIKKIRMIFFSSWRNLIINCFLSFFFFKFSKIQIKLKLKKIGNFQNSKIENLQIEKSENLNFWIFEFSIFGDFWFFRFFDFLKIWKFWKSIFSQMKKYFSSGFLKSSSKFGIESI